MKKNIGKLQPFLLGVLSAFSPLAMDLYLPGLPELQQDLHTSTSLAQVTITASLLGLALGQVIVGPWSDRIGRRKPLLWGTIAFALSSAAIVFAPNIWVLIILRLVQGLAGSTGIVLSLAGNYWFVYGKTLTQQIAINQTINGVFPVLAPVFGGIIIAWADWQMTFWVLAVLGVLLFAGVLFSLPETLPAEKAAPQEKQSVVAGFGKLFKQRQFVLFALTQAFMTAALFAYISGSSFVLQKISGLSVTTFGIVYAINGAGIAFMSSDVRSLGSKVRWVHSVEVVYPRRIYWRFVVVSNRLYAKVNLDDFATIVHRCLNGWWDYFLDDGVGYARTARKRRFSISVAWFGTLCPWWFDVANRRVVWADNILANGCFDCRCPSYWCLNF